MYEVGFASKKGLTTALSLGYLIMIIVIFRCYFSREHIALSYKKIV